MALALLAVGGPALAQQRPLSTSLPCARLSALIAAQGAAVISTGPYTYDRYVRDGSFCAAGEAPLPETVPSADNRACFIGYRCGEISRGSR